MRCRLVAAFLAAVVIVTGGCSGRPDRRGIERLILEQARAGQRGAVLYTLDPVYPGGRMAFVMSLFTREGVSGLEPAGYGKIVGYVGDDPAVEFTPQITPFLASERKLRIADLDRVAISDVRNTSSTFSSVEATLIYKPTTLGAILMSHGGTMSHLMAEPVTVGLEKWDKGWRVRF
jgi:hypothetical protein